MIFRGEVLDPRNFPRLDTWRMELKDELLRRRGYRSDYSGLPLIDCDMHEGIITRAVVPKSTGWQRLIFHEYNCFLLLREEHIPQPPSREWCMLKSFERYGKVKVVEWFYSLPWKSVPFRIENYS